MRLLVVALVLGCALAAQAAAGAPALFAPERAPLWRSVGLAAAPPEAQPPAPADTAGGASMRKVYPGRAFLYSAVLPGTGQRYAGAKRRAVGFYAAEGAVALVSGTLWYIWRGKGNDLEDQFQAIAMSAAPDTGWSAEAYLNWRNTTRARTHNSFTHALPCSTFVDPQSADYAGPRSLGGCGGSEQQQYYELLGKYDQFVVGWKDIRYVQSGNPPDNPADVDSVESVRSDLRESYDDMRGDSNRCLKRASRAFWLLAANHAIAAVDAARTARARARGVSEADLEHRTRLAFLFYPGPRSQVPMLAAYRSFR